MMGRLDSEVKGLTGGMYTTLKNHRANTHPSPVSKGASQRPLLQRRKLQRE